MAEYRASIQALVERTEQEYWDKGQSQLDEALKRKLTHNEFDGIAMMQKKRYVLPDSIKHKITTFFRNPVDVLLCTRNSELHSQAKNKTKHSLPFVELKLVPLPAVETKNALHRLSVWQH